MGISFKQISGVLCCVVMLSACQTVKDNLHTAQESIHTSSLRFQRLMASLDMQRYVPGMPDMPVYRGFKPQGDENAVYDVVEGRIIDITYSSDIADVQKVRDFYDIALNQLGWKPTERAHYYRRDHETLMLKVTPSGQTTVLHISLQPDDK